MPDTGPPGGDGKLAILDFGLMTEIKDEQKFGFIEARHQRHHWPPMAAKMATHGVRRAPDRWCLMEAIAHLVHRDYEKIGNGALLNKEGL